MQRRRRRRTNRHRRFIAMSKILGIFIFLGLGAIIIYAMLEMHEQNNLDSLPQLIISVFAIGSVYVGFYLTMAKWEHIEEEKTTREKELIKLKAKFNQECCTEEEIEKLEEEIKDLDEKEKELEDAKIEDNN